MAKGWGWGYPHLPAMPSGSAPASNSASTQARFALAIAVHSTGMPVATFTAGGVIVRARSRSGAHSPPPTMQCSGRWPVQRATRVHAMIGVSAVLEQQLH